ncbi:hypothetical protein DFA_09294 [Cavenderia fasciculata]|uniref:Uncharacterized protein n=1 Tax=Cavenderia fasciculata TaxID=261658 RepID=F4Q782_CACFS|nr:uncharacterized protein DFA_09294 [Cavenderia fasciculata]EGG16264.1 hypothetical protein DFA_09294 [Cavenderia fasciculata]|eukprot:XP_004354648.1 hypothetical protein DFA_09294 [Cavenderia fasciculata]
MNNDKSSSSSSSSSFSLSPRGGLSDLTLLKIINDLENNQDIVCLLMTCKAYYREFMKQYAKVITFKGIEPNDVRSEKLMISSQMRGFKEIYNASLEASKNHIDKYDDDATSITITNRSTRVY